MSPPHPILPSQPTSQDVVTATNLYRSTASGLAWLVGKVRLWRTSRTATFSLTWFCQCQEYGLPFDCLLGDSGCECDRQCALRLKHELMLEDELRAEEEEEIARAAYARGIPIAQDLGAWS